MANTKIKAYFLRVDEKSGEQYRGYFGEIENTLEAKQKYVNYDRPHGLIQCVSIDDIDIICHDEGKLLRFPANRAWIDDNGKVLDIFAGNLLCVKHDSEGNFVSIEESDRELIEKYLQPVLVVFEGALLTAPEDTLLEWEEE